MTKFQHLRQQFPALKRQYQGSNLVFMDGPGGTQVPQAVIDAVNHYYQNSNANLHGAFITSQESDEVLDNCRAKMATFLGAEGPHTISIGQNMTTLNFALSRAMSRTLQPGDEVLITQLDHEANRGPWLSLRAHGIIVKEVRLLKNGYLDYGHLTSQLSDRTRLLAMGMSSNLTGTVNNIAVAREQAYRVGAHLLLDAVHYAPHYPIDVQALGCDFLLCSAYKFYGPHLGFLYARPGLLDTLPTDRLRTAPQAAPYSIETGTLNHAAIAGTGAALDFIAGFGTGADLRSQLLSAMEAIGTHERNLLEQLFQGLQGLPGLSVIGPGLSDQRRSPTLAIKVAGKDPKAICSALAKSNICAWSGHFYALRATEVLGLLEQGGVTRLGLSAYNNTEDVERVIAAFQAILV
jgi:cysteine desulfurase family protein (TIGR01976 family)